MLILIRGSRAPTKRDAIVREVVERVLGAEDQAKARIETARQQAAATKSHGDEQAAAIVAAAREQAVASARAALDSARNDARAALERALAEDEASGVSFAAGLGLATDAVVESIVAMLCETSIVKE